MTTLKMSGESGDLSKGYPAKIVIFYVKVLILIDDKR